MIYDINKLGFSTQIKLKEYVRDLLKRIGRTNSVKNTHKEYYQFLYEFCFRHPDKTKMMDVVDLQIEKEYDYYRLL